MEGSLPVDTTISHYRILGRLGAGGMGEVYLAEDTQLDRKVAIKFLRTESISDEEAKRRLIREARAAARLDHPNICSIYEVAEEGGRNFIVMQYVEGETLAELVHRRPLALRESLDIAVQVADALAEARSHGIIHRDIKPQNIMLAARGQVKLMDFGLAQAVQEKSPIEGDARTETLMTEPGVIVGTVPYMSPEQVRGETLDARSDIFSFGAVLYEMVSGRQPFAAENLATTTSAILTTEPTPLARYSREAPAELERIVSKALRKNREERYQTATDLLIDLKSLRHHHEVEAATSTREARAPDTSTFEYTIAAVLRHKVPLAVLALALLGLAGVAVYRWTSDGKTIDSVAILPFVNVGADPNTEYLSDGITESLISSLSQLPNLKVMSRSSAFRYKGREIDPQAVGRELKVQAVVTGQVVQRGEGLAISLELVDARDNRQLWGEQYNRKLSDILAVQAEISREISQKLRLRLSGAEQKQLTRLQTEKAEAYQLYLKGRYQWNKLAEEETRKAIEYFNRAIESDPSYALAYAGLADCYSNLVLFGSSPPKDTFPKAKAAAMKAIELDDSLAAAHSALGRVRLYFDWDLGAEKEFKRAIQLNSKDAITREAYSNFLRAMARLDEALSETKLAQELDPLSPYISVSVGWTLFYMRRYDEAIAQFRRTLEMDPAYGNPHWGIGRAYVQKGMYKEAITEMERGGLDFPMPLGTRGHAHALMGNRAEAQRLLDEARNNPLRTLDVALIHIGLGQKDQAFEWLQKAYEARSPWLVFGLKPDPRYDSLRSDPRFADLLRRMGLAP